MKIIKKIIIVIILLALTISGIGLAIYFTNLSGDLSSKSEDYSYFGSYVGGILTPLLSILSILIIYYIHLNEKSHLRKQIEEQKKLNQLNIYQDNISRIKMDIDKILNLELYPKDFVDILNDFPEIIVALYLNEEKSNLFLRSERNHQIEMLSERKWELSAFVSTLYEVLDPKTFFIIFSEDRVYNISHHLHNLVDRLTYLVFFNNKCHEIIKSYRMTMYNISQYFEIVKLLKASGKMTTDSIITYYESFDKNRLPILVKYNDLDFDETKDAIATTLITFDKDFEKYKDKIEFLIGKIEIIGYDYQSKVIKIKIDSVIKTIKWSDICI